MSLLSLSLLSDSSAFANLLILCHPDIKYLLWKPAEHSQQSVLLVVAGGRPSDVVLWLCEKTVDTSQGLRGGGEGRAELQQARFHLCPGWSLVRPVRAPFSITTAEPPQPSDFTVNFTPWEKLFWWLLLGLGRSDGRWWLSDLFSVYVHVESSKEVLIM